MQVPRLTLFLTFFSKHINIVQLGNTNLLQLAQTKQSPLGMFPLPPPPSGTKGVLREVVPQPPLSGSDLLHRPYMS
jgi:hypothetical protein